VHDDATGRRRLSTGACSEPEAKVHQVNLRRDGIKLSEEPATLADGSVHALQLHPIASAQLTPSSAHLASDVADLKVGPKLPPILIVHGDADTLVPLDQSQRFAAHAAALGLRVGLVDRHLLAPRA
jgi:acetyl esterase/lipase